jgi:hypothetical protein
MKATINQLWSTCREIVSYNDSDTERPKSIAELKKCENVLLGQKVDKNGPTEVMIDNDIFFVMPVKLHHPMGGTMYVLEVM